MSKIIDLVQNLTFRKWLYGVALAVLVLLGGEGIISATQQENIGAVIQAVLQTAPAAALGLAYRKVAPAASDDTHSIPGVIGELPFNWADSATSFEFDADPDDVAPTAAPADAKHAAI